MEASKALFDAFLCCKSHSLGTNFTLACPFTILAHYTELDWAAQFGIEAGIVRIGVGMEGQMALLKSFDAALNAAEVAVVGTRLLLLLLLLLPAATLLLSPSISKHHPIDKIQKDRIKPSY